MRIKKTSATAPVQAQVLNANSGSEIDTYSCNYINNIRKIATATISAFQTLSDQSIIDFGTFNTTTSLLTWDSTNKGIVIGTGISKVLISGNVHIRYTSSNSVTYGLSILKNGTIVGNSRCYKPTNNPISCSFASSLIDVEEDDIIQMAIISTSGSPTVTDVTNLTVEAIN